MNLIFHASAFLLPTWLKINLIELSALDMPEVAKGHILESFSERVLCAGRLAQGEFLKEVPELRLPSNCSYVTSCSVSLITNCRSLMVQYESNYRCGKSQR